MKNASEYETIKIWLDRKCSSENSKRSHLRDISYFIRDSGIDPDQIVAEWKRVRFNPIEKEKFLITLNETLEDYLSQIMAKKDLTIGTKLKLWSRVKSFFKTFHIPIEVVEPKINVYTVYHNRTIEKEEIRRILDASELREKAFFLMMLESGLRPDTLVRLKYKHIKEEFEKGIIPMKIVVPAEIVKDKVGDRFTFIGEDGYKYLKEYLSTLGKLSDEDYIFQPSRKKKLKGKPLPAHTFSNYFRRLALKLNITEPSVKGKPYPVRLYCLRKYFRANFKGDESIREFLMGHTLGVDVHYINRDQVERFRQVYAQAYPYIRVYEQTTSFEKALMEFLTSPQYARERQFYFTQYFQTDEGRRILEQAVSNTISVLLARLGKQDQQNISPSA